jgi:hypothetical protein
MTQWSLVPRRTFRTNDLLLAPMMTSMGGRSRATAGIVAQRRAMTQAALLPGREANPPRTTELHGDDSASKVGDDVIADPFRGTPAAGAKRLDVETQPYCRGLRGLVVLP